MIRTALLCLLILPAWSCVGITPPAVEVGPPTLVDRSSAGVRFEVPVTLTNRHATPLPLTEAEYRFRVQGIDSYAYLEMPAVVLGVDAQRTLMLPAALETDGVDPLGRDWSISGSVVYTPDSPLRTVLTETGVPLPSVGFSARGTLE
jgi:hypothetical protein